jgi:CheY-like chemotaxis protein
MDHMMPDMDGIEATKRIRDLGYDVPIVALTANAVVGQENMFLENGFDDFISKPIDMRQLNSVLNRLVRDKQPQEVIEAAIKQYGDQNQDAEKDETSQEETLNMQISGLDIPKGLRRYRGDIRAYLMLLRSYAANIDSVLKTVELLSDERIVDYEIAVHGIKGASLDIFAEEVGTLAKKLEEEAKARNMDFLYENNAAFLEAVRKLVAEIKEALAVWDAENPKPKKDKPDGEILKKLVVACKNYNMKEADAAIEEIEKYQYTSDDGLALWLRESVDRVDFEEIIEKLSAEN